jgi:acetyl esterase/lipase
LSRPPRPWFQRPSRTIPLAALALGLIAALVWFISPWPASLLIRGLFEKGARDTVSEMEPYEPKNAVDARRNLAYSADDPDARFDLFTPKGNVDPLPTVVWIHGGAWISGFKEDVDPYVRILASHGYTTVSLDYTVAPEAEYPTALTQLNTALGYLVAHAAELHIDPATIVLAGDSAGAQLTAQLATLVTSPAYAAKVGLSPTLTKQQLRAVILNCGIYDVRGIPSAPGIGGWGFRIALWAYLGTKDWAHTRGGEEMTTLDDVTKDFPSTWISGGNDDPLTAGQSKVMATQLQNLGVDVTPVFYSADHQPLLPHEYQFHLKLKDARDALQSTVDFLARVTS